VSTVPPGDNPIAVNKYYYYYYYYYKPPNFYLEGAPLELQSLRGVTSFSSGLSTQAVAHSFCTFPKSTAINHTTVLLTSVNEEQRKFT